MKTQNLISVLIFTSLFSSCENSVEPDEINYHNKILFTSSRSGISQLYMMNPDGTDIKQITNGEFWHSNGRWSPDIKKIVCNTEEGSTTAGFQMAVMDVDGLNRQLLGYGNQMSWHPSGDEILFSYCPSCEIGIFNIKLYSIDPDGIKRVVSEEFAGEAAFSPDGEKVAFAFSDVSDSVSLPQIVIIDYPTFTNAKYIGPKGTVSPFWSPDGKEIIFSKREISSEPNDDIYIMNSDGSNVHRITNNSSNMPYAYPRFSPNGEKIIFLAYTVDGTQKWYLYMVDKDGNNLHKVIDDDTITSCDWSK